MTRRWVVIVRMVSVQIPGQEKLQDKTAGTGGHANVQYPADGFKTNDKSIHSHSSQTGNHARIGSTRLNL
jgi:hypothetical protein